MAVHPAVATNTGSTFPGAVTLTLAATGPVRIVAIEDDPAYVPLLEELLRPCRQEFRLAHAPITEHSDAESNGCHSDVSLLALCFHDISSPEVIRRTRAAHPGVPLIVLAGAPDERLAFQALKEGAQDYLIKSQVSTTTLVRAMRYAIERQRLQLVSEETNQQQLRLKDEFLSHVSHELRSPIASIYQFLSLLLDNIPGKLNQEQREFLEIVARNTGELRGLIDDLLDATRAETGKLTVAAACMAAGQLVHDAVERYSAIAADRGIRLESQISSGLPPVSADPLRARQMLSNLLDNACKFTPSQGCITVRVENDKELPGLLHFSVADTGCGIAADSLPHVFERLYQGRTSTEASRKGLGLGLHITRELVTRHGGQIWVESELGVGTTFHFTLQAFSVETLLTPLMQTAVAAQKNDFALVTVTLAPADAIKRQLSEKLLAAVAQTLGRCTLPDMDVLLPRFECPDRSARFFIVACANEKGAQVLTQRVEDQLKALPELRAEPLTVHVSFAPLPTPDSDTPASGEDLLRSVAGLVQGRIENQEGRTQHV
ncbi:MAG TPA: hybrid sensor histidine kinase/response regulator [Candidatus Sulfotelmatobacter sp.]|nr:hybrid sensor histidine kinase/response regulator [Candidatus Sulfotelmatobacter sp.]